MNPAAKIKPGPVTQPDGSKVYYMRRNFMYQPNRLDSSEYQGKPAYRRSVIVETSNRWEPRLPERDAPADRPADAPLGLSKEHIPSLPKSGKFTCYRGASLMELKLQTPARLQAPSRFKRSEITEFSEASRRRMLHLMAKIDTGMIPLFVTLTYPDEFPLYQEEYKRHLEIFCARLLRAWPNAAVVWKLEFKQRQSGKNRGMIAPHYHLFVYGAPWQFPCKREKRQWYRLEQKGRCGGQMVWREMVVTKKGVGLGHATFVDPADPAGSELENGNVWGADSFRRWVSRNWYDVVSTGDDRHYRAGTKVERLRTIKGAFAYAGKRYMAKKEDMPKLDHKPGRFWGVIGRKNLKLGVREEQELTEHEAVTLRRIIRRYRLANTPPEKRSFIRKGGFYSDEFTIRLFCDVEFWVARLPRLLGRPERDCPF